LPDGERSRQVIANEAGKRHGLELLPDSVSIISPSKARLVARAVVAARARALLPYSQGEKLDGKEGSLTRLSEKIFLQLLVEQHNQDGKHLELHQPVCVGHQFQDGVVLGCFSKPMLLLHVACGINSGWPLLAGFDTTFGITSKKFELMGISIDSL
jgi:hypothetical protein